MSFFALVSTKEWPLRLPVAEDLQGVKFYPQTLLAHRIRQTHDEALENAFADQASVTESLQRPLTNV
jgi:hypothetical protein